MIEKLLAEISQKDPISQLDAGEFASIKVSGIEFHIGCYKAKGLGHISLMRAKVLGGLMKMDTLIINPTGTDLPLYSYDRVYALGKDTLIIEMYDTISGEFNQDKLNRVNRKYLHLTERDPGQHWYDSIKLESSVSKKCKKKHTPELDLLTIDHLEAYFDSAEGHADKDVKKEKASYYVNGLLEKGGPSTDVFIKELGREKTEKLFKTILFGTN